MVTTAMDLEAELAEQVKSLWVDAAATVATVGQGSVSAQMVAVGPRLVRSKMGYTYLHQETAVDTGVMGVVAPGVEEAELYWPRVEAEVEAEPAVGEVCRDPAGVEAVPQSAY